MVGEDVFQTCLEWLNTRAVCNDTNIVLIPKVDNPTSMKDLLSTALCKVLYRIIAKVLANRLKVLLPLIINESQLTFVLGRAITDIIIAFELIHHMKGPSQGDYGHVDLKIDISKAYDKISWKYLQGIMLHMGFAPQWVRLIMTRVTTLSYKVSMNGELVGPIIPKRSLQQGDP